MARATPIKRRAEFYAEKVVKNGTKPAAKSKPTAIASNRTGRKSGTRTA